MVGIRLRSSIAAISVIAVLLAIPGLAQASIKIGVDAGPGAGSTGCSGGYFCNLLLESVPGAQVESPSAGVVTGVRVRHSGGYGRASIRILRDLGGSNYLNVREQSVVIPAVTAPSIPTDFPVRLQISAGDRVGMGWETVYDPLFIDVVPGTGRYANGTVTPHAPGSQLTYSSNAYGIALLSTVEPDTDGDGFGDETQDGCPVSAARQLPCSAPIVRLLKTGTQRFAKLSVVQSVSGDAKVVSKAAVKVGKKTFNSKSVQKSLTAGSAATFKFGFSSSGKKAITKALKAKRKLKATVTSTASDAFGNSTATQAIKLKS